MFNLNKEPNRLNSEIPASLTIDIHITPEKIMGTIVNKPTLSAYFGYKRKLVKSPKARKIGQLSTSESAMLDSITEAWDLGLPYPEKQLCRAWPQRKEAISSIKALQRQKLVLSKRFGGRHELKILVPTQQALESYAEHITALSLAFGSSKPWVSSDYV